MNRFVFAALAAAAAVSAYGQVDPNRVVAIVNGEEIKGDEYYSTMEFLPGIARQIGGANQVERGVPGFLTLELLINEFLEKQLAQKQGVAPTQAEIDAEYEFRRKQDPQFDAHLAAAGRTVDQAKHDITIGLTEFKLQTVGITVTNQEADDYYAKHPDEFTKPKSYKLSVIAVQSEADKTAVDGALGASKPFADVAKQFSVEASKNLGGSLGVIPETQLPPALKAALEATKIGSTSAWVPNPSSNVFYKFEVNDIQPPKKQALDEALRKQIRQKLMVDRGRVKTDLVKEMRQMRIDAKIDIKEPRFQEPFQQMMKQLTAGG